MAEAAILPLETVLHVAPQEKVYVIEIIPPSPGTGDCRPTPGKFVNRAH